MKTADLLCVILLLCIGQRFFVASAFDVVGPSSTTSTTTTRCQISSTRLNAESSGVATEATTTTTALEDDERSRRLIAAAKEFTEKGSGFFSDADPSFLSDDFVFRGPFVGPLNKVDYVNTLTAFSPHRSFPDLAPNAWGFSIDPENPNKVWFMIRMTGTFEKDLQLVEGLPKLRATGAKVRGAPETYSILFEDDDGSLKIKGLTVGYVADRFQGNTGGLGALFGLLHAAGYGNLVSLITPPSPLFRAAANFEIPGAPKAVSNPEDIPSWWTSAERLDDGL